MRYLRKNSRQVFKKNLIWTGIANKFLLQRKKMIGKYFEQDKGFSINFLQNFVLKKKELE